MTQAFKIGLSGALIAVLPFISLSSHAATAIDLSKQNFTALQSFASADIKKTKALQDANKTTHYRIQQLFKGHMVWGADAVVHVKQHADLAQAISGKAASTMNGVFYQDLEQDLAATPNAVLQEAQAKKAINQAVQAYQAKQDAYSSINQQAAELIVFVDKNKKAHWAYLVSFYAQSKMEDKPSRPHFIVDALSLDAYVEWDSIKTMKEVRAGGFGGNEKMGKLVYDGLPGNLAELRMQRDAKTKLCYMMNDDVIVSNYNASDNNDLVERKAISFSCKKKNKKHKLYWHGEMDAVNKGYSPSADALFNGNMTKQMYKDWYNVSVLNDSHDKPILLHMVVHKLNYDNAYWDDTTSTMTFGDGRYKFYPLTSLGVTAHEVSHGFTSQHSNLEYYGQSGGMNEAFSDMAAQAAEFFAYGKSSWEIGAEINKKPGRALRYMYQPSKDCDGSKPGTWCSIDSADQYEDYMDVHHSSGVYNHFFYLLGTSEGWDTKKAFDVMVAANRYYWTSSVDFESGACGVINAAHDLGYNIKDVITAFDTVKVDTKNCLIPL